MAGTQTNTPSPRSGASQKNAKPGSQGNKGSGSASKSGSPRGGSSDQHEKAGSQSHKNDK